jgi:hypothetical protein
MILHIDTAGEQALRDAGFAVPQKPIPGKVFYFDIEVGFVDNFTGLVVRDEYQDAVLKVIEVSKTSPMGIWNPPPYAREVMSKTAE